MFQGDSPTPNTGFLDKISVMAVSGHQDIYGGDEGLRHHLCLHHGEHLDEGASREHMEDLHEDEHGYNPGHRGEYGCPEHTPEDEPTEFHDMHERNSGIGEIHRGIGVSLSDDLHRMVHDQSRPAHERARALLSHVSDHPEGDGHLGTHWTTENGVAEDFAETAAGWKRDEDDKSRPGHDHSFGRYTEDDEDEGPQHYRLPKPGTAVVFHAHEPHPDVVDRDPHRWGNGDVYGYSEHGEREVPVRSSHDLDLRGISWAQVHSEDDPDESHLWPEYEHHDFGHEHTAAAQPGQAAVVAHFEYPLAPGHLGDQGYRITDESRGYSAGRSHPGGTTTPTQSWSTLHMTHPNGESHGQLDYSHTGYHGAPEVHVEDIRTNKGHTGEGIASALMDHLHELHPEPARITHSMRTPGGEGWWDRYTSSRPEVAEREERQAEPDEEEPEPEWHQYDDRNYSGFERYRGSHTPPHPEYGHQALPHYTGQDPDEPVRIYRSAPPGTDSINHGDWVSTDHEYVSQHRQDNEGRHWPVLTAEVPARHVYWDENDPREHGYAGPTILHPDIHGHDGQVSGWKKAGAAEVVAHFEEEGISAEAADDTSYRGQHQGPAGDDGEAMHEVGSGKVYPADIHQRPDWYISNEETGAWDSWDKVRKSKDWPSRRVTMYRSLPSPHREVNTGDWVTSSAAYAREHGKQSNSDDDWPVVKFEARADQLRTEGNSINEWSYHGPRVNRALVHFSGGKNHRGKGPRGGKADSMVHEHEPDEMYAEYSRQTAERRRRIREEKEQREGGTTASAHDDYRMRHTAPGSPDDDATAPMHNVRDMMPDAYEHPEWYGNADLESGRQVRKAEGDPEARISVYRALPHPHQEINQGDWVSSSAAYARLHGESNLRHEPSWHVVRAVVPARHLFSEGNSLAEWGYQGPDLQAEHHAGPFTGLSHQGEESHEVVAHFAAEATATGYGPKPEWQRGPEGASDEEQSAHYDRQSKIRHDWDAHVLHGISTGELHPDRAKELGYYFDGHQTDERGNHKWQPLPQHLYHVTTNLPGVREQGLKSRQELEQERGGHGLGGGPDDTISLTDDHDVAKNILRAVHEFHGVVNGRYTPAQMWEDAKAGKGAPRPFHEDLASYHQPGWKDGDPLPRRVDSAVRGKELKTGGLVHSPQEMAEREGPGWTPHHESSELTGGDGVKRYNDWERDLNPDERRAHAADFYKNFAAYRSWAGGHEDPLFFSTDTKAFAAKDPKDFAIVHARPRPGAMGHQVSALGEWRTGTGDALETHRAERLEGGHLKEASLSKEAVVTALENPHTHGQDWYHGTQAHPEDLKHGFSDPMNDDENAWNARLGTHFTSDHDLGRWFAKGEHNTRRDDDGYALDDDEEPNPSVVHARLHLTNPKVYASEHDMDHEAYEHEFAAGNHPSKDFPDDPESREWDEEHERPGMYEVHREFGDSHIPAHATSPVGTRNAGHPVRQIWLTSHPDAQGIARRFRERLQAQGHDGIVYGNAWERGPGGMNAPSAIAFNPDSIEVTGHHGDEEPCPHGRGGHAVVAHFDEPRTAAGPLPNPLTGSAEWFHGTRAPREEFTRGFDDPAATDPEGMEYPEAQESGSWNRSLGNHFAADHGVARSFAEGEHSSPHNDWGRDSSPSVVHARLAIRNPKVYGSEYDLDSDAYEHAWSNGNHPSSHFSGDDEEDSESWPTAFHLHRTYGNGKIPAGAATNPPGTWGIRSDRPDRTEWLNGHPDRFEIGQNFKRHLMDQGHDGIVYRNEYEHSGKDHPHADTAAIAFSPHQAEVTAHRPADGDGREVVAHFEEPRTAAGPYMQQKLFHMQPDPTLHEPESGRHNPADPEGHMAWREENEPDYKRPEETWDHPEYGNRDEELGIYRHPDKGWHCHACTAHAGEPVFHEAPDEVERHDTTRTDWNEEYPRIPGTVHRGMRLEDDGSYGRGSLSAYREAPAAEHTAREILGKLGDFGTHWTGDEAQARHYADVGTGHHRTEGHTMNVVVHARKPAREDIETDPETLADQNVFGIGYHDDEEIPLRGRAPVHVAGVSWKFHDEPHAAWRRHDFGEGAEHTAALDAVAHFDEGPLPEYHGESLYHGTRSILEPGEHLTVEEAERHPNNPDIQTDPYVHATTDPREAHRWGERAKGFQAEHRHRGTDRERRIGPGQNADHAYRPRVYEVHPTGHVEPDLEYADTEHDSWRSAHPMRVKREVESLTCYDCPDTGGNEEHWPDHPHYEYLRQQADEDEADREERGHTAAVEGAPQVTAAVVAHFEDDDEDPDDYSANDEWDEDAPPEKPEDESAEESVAHRSYRLPYMTKPPEGELIDHLHHHHGLDARTSDLYMNAKDRERWHDSEHRYKTNSTHQHDHPQGTPGEEHWPAVFQPSEHTDFPGGTRGDWGRVPGHTVPFRPLRTSESVSLPEVTAVHPDDQHVAMPQPGEEMWGHLQEGHGVSGAKTPGTNFMNDLHGRFHDGRTPDPRRVPHQHEDQSDPPAGAQSARDSISRMFTPIPEEELEAQQRAREPKPERTDDREYSLRDVSRHYDWEGFDKYEIEHLVHRSEHAVFTKEDVPVKSLRLAGEHGLVPPHSYEDIAAGDDDEGERLRELERGYDNGEPVPPIVTVRDGKHHIIADGSHRAAIHAERGHTHIPAFVTQRTIYPGEHTAVTAAYDWHTDEGPFTWDEIARRHPRVYGDDEDHEPGMGEGGGHDIADAAAELYHDRPGHPYSESTGELHPENSDEMQFHPRTVDVNRIDYMHADPGDGRVNRAKKGFQDHRQREKIPPLVLVHRHGVYQVADGHHRAGGAAQAGWPSVRAYVAYSPHEDEPFAGRDGEPPQRGPFHGAETENRPPMLDHNGEPGRRISFPGFPHTTERPRPQAHEGALVAHFEEPRPVTLEPVHDVVLAAQGPLAPAVEAARALGSWEPEDGEELLRAVCDFPEVLTALRDGLLRLSRVTEDMPVHPEVADMICDMARSLLTASDDAAALLRTLPPEASWQEPGPPNR